METLWSLLACMLLQIQTNTANKESHWPLSRKENNLFIWHSFYITSCFLCAQGRCSPTANPMHFWECIWNRKASIVKLLLNHRKMELHNYFMYCFFFHLEHFFFLFKCKMCLYNSTSSLYLWTVFTLLITNDWFLCQRYKIKGMFSVKVWKAKSAFNTVLPKHSWPCWNRALKLTV